MERFSFLQKILELFPGWPKERLTWYKIGRICDSAFANLQIIIILCFLSVFIFVRPLSFQAKDILWISQSLMLVFYFCEMCTHYGKDFTSSYTLYNKSFVAFGPKAANVARNYFIINLVFSAIHSVVTIEFFFLSLISTSDFLLMMAVNIANISLDFIRRKAMSKFYEMTTDEYLHKANENIERIKKYFANTPASLNKFALFYTVEKCFLTYFLLMLFVAIRIIVYTKSVTFLEDTTPFKEHLWMLVFMAGPIANCEIVEDYCYKRNCADRLFSKKRFVAFGHHSTKLARRFLLINVLYAIVVASASILFWFVDEVPTFDMMWIVAINLVGISLHVALRWSSTTFYNLMASRHLDTVIVHPSKAGTPESDGEQSVPLKQKER